MPKRCSVVVVEDHEETLYVVARLLSAHGHTVCKARTVAEAMTMLDGQDVAILDLNLSDGLGTEVLRKIRDEGRSIRAAIWSASEYHGTAFEVAALAPDAVFRKPNDLDTMLRWVDAVA